MIQSLTKLWEGYLFNAEGAIVDLPQEGQEVFIPSGLYPDELYRVEKLGEGLIARNENHFISLSYRDRLERWVATGYIACPYTPLERTPQIL